jgi:hypothetical protein
VRIQAVYQIKNTKNGRVYVGSSVGVERRWNQHRKELDAGGHHSCILQREWVEHGAACFEFSIIEEVPDLNLLRKRERVWIKELNAVRRGYNRIYDTDVKTDNTLPVKRILLDKNGVIVPSCLSRNDRKEFFEVGQVVFLRQLHVRGHKVETRVQKQKKKKKKQCWKPPVGAKGKKPSGCLVWAKDQKPYLISS